MAIKTKKPFQRREYEAKKPQEEEENGGFATDPVSGKLLITENFKDKKSAHSTDNIDEDDMDDMMRMKDGAQTGKISNKKRGRSGEDSDDNDSVDLPLPHQKRKKPKFDYGAEYRSKKAGGDVLKKGQSYPFAYVPLNKSTLNRR